ncbi:uroporphyrinogen-III synthase [Tropicimonas marinistellae]|uniref:uroporphyrinogen-III synthase n=1 Tax=Tropicimonas marinistellae TaxID=1739787 RepID=UPI000831FD5E|nr:uroporphyrinogen-III synthase [Tropicimonas marinistellae]
MNLRDTTLLLTRPETASRRFADQVETRLGHFGLVVIAPILEIVSVPADLPDVSRVAWIFTSSNAIPEVIRRGTAEGAAAWCVGQRTGEAARQAGFSLAGVAPDAATLCARIVAAHPAGPLLHATGRHQRGDLAGEIRSAGLDARSVVVYDQVERPLDRDVVAMLATPKEIVAPLFSPRSSAILSEAARGRQARINAVAISAAAAERWISLPDEALIVAETPDATGMLTAMGCLFDADRSA